ncbi:MAG: isoprenyl transferase [Candidatus Cloacimonetes bacterium]|nr:isoprenyl transferase [Candidatus Cloacimonadota bacterium]
MDYKELILKLDQTALPRHVAVIMDGNGRWARLHRMQRLKGHKKGVEAVRKLVEVSVEVGIKYLTIYAFSTENWRRSKLEVNYLLKLIMDSLVNEIEELDRNGVNIRFIGSRKELSDSYNHRVIDVCRKSWHNDRLYLNVAMNYGGRREILEAVQAICQDAQAGKIDLSMLSDEIMNDYLYTAGMPDPDLIIRTSGELRLSNFLVWQSAYSEYWFTEILWPDFDKAEFIRALLDYQNRERRFGARWKG